MVSRYLLGAMSLLAIAGCGRIAPNQSEGAVRISLGEFSKEYAAAPVAALFARYAVFAARAYDEYPPGTKEYPAPVKRYAQFRDMEKAAARAIAGWRVVQSHEGALCPKDQPNCTSGLGFQIWHSPRGCQEVVIAFRGTNFESQDDWTSNLRWFTPKAGRYDQYDQVRTHIAAIVANIRARCRGRVGQITAVGHSLGGGLAQQAAYAEPAITRVYAFDPSFVTGFYDVYEPGTRRTAALARLEIDRIYEHGEILAYPRFVLRHIYPPAECDPTIRSVRFNLLTGRASSEHSIDALTINLLKIATDQRPVASVKPFTDLPRLTNEQRRRLDCADLPNPRS